MRRFFETGGLCFAVSALVLFTAWLWLCSDFGGIRERTASWALQNGDVVFIRARTWRSFAVRAVDGCFSHVGLVRVAGGVPYVVHASPEGESVRMDLAEDFFSPADHAALYRPRDRRAAESASREALGYFERSTPFDRRFDISDDARLYCTELVWRAYKRVGLDLSGGTDFLSGVPVYGLVLLPEGLRGSAGLEKVVDTVD